MQRHLWLPILIFATGLLLSLGACQHDPTFEMEDPTDPTDTTDNPIDTTDNPVDTTNQGVPCDPEVVYFDQQVLPILRSNCALSGCHDEATAQDGVVLTSYENVMNTADVRPFDLNGSDLYEMITESDPDDRMPPPPNAPLSNDQINLISKWILQGAENLTCDPDTGDCDTENVSFAANIQPVLSTYCLGCHSGGNPSGGINLSTHAGVAAVAESGQLYGAVARLSGYTPMPFGGDPLPSCEVDQIEAWVNAGAPDN